LEVDENQHRGDTQCDVSRMHDVTASVRIGGSVPEDTAILWIRYNPDAFRVDGVLRTVPTRMRLARLAEFIRTYAPVPLQMLATVYMYYDVLDGDPAVFTGGEYDGGMKAHVLSSVIA
jgi:hypothetical protein